MATETDTLSLPTSTATDVTESTCLPKFHPTFQPPAPCDPGASSAAAAEWDTKLTMPDLRHPLAYHQHGALSPFGCISGSASGNNYNPGTRCSKNGRITYRAQAKMEMREGPGKAVEEACQPSLNHFPHPGFAFPMPALDFDFRIAVRLNPDAARVDTSSTKEITTIAAGVWSGSFGYGRVMAGSYDLGQARGFRPMRLIECAFVMRTSDEVPAVLEMRTRGSLSGPSDVLDALLNPRNPKDIDPRRYSFRMFAIIKTADKRYAEIVNCSLWVASGSWRGDHLVIDAYRVT